jgi:endonuclease/exonuclease/phosphatase (EEP) superfamily protein YafD
MGDMNDFNVSAPMDSLKDAGMKNAWWEGGFGYGATYHEGWLRLRIDHIYYNDKLRLKDVKVVKTDLSVHNILIADFSVVN